MAERVKKPEPGDWVRFYQGGTLVIGIVQYVRPAASWSASEWSVRTDVGPVESNAIEELRR